MKNARGITLIALIITIVVLLIISVITINAVSGEKLIEHANNAAAAYEAAAREENAMIRDIVSGMYDYAAQATPDQISEYGFYFNRTYRFEFENGFKEVTFYEDGSIKGTSYIEQGYKEGDRLIFTDALGNKCINIEHLSYNVPYTATSSMNETYTAIVDNDGNLLVQIEFPDGTAVYSENAITIGDNITLTLTNEGREFAFYEETFILQ